MVPPHLRVLPVRGGEEDRRGGQGDPEDPQAAEDEGEEGDQNPAAGSVTLKTQEEPPADRNRQKQLPGLFGGLEEADPATVCEACVTAWA